MPRKGSGELYDAAGGQIASMRPGLLCPGRAAHFERLLDQRMLASMRPGLLCPGRGPPPAPQRRGRGASMRPGLLCPGRGPLRAMPGGRKTASMRPGLLCPGRRGCPPCPRDGRVASMRPGLLCPGRVAAWMRIPIGSSGFNEAGAVMPRKDTGFNYDLFALYPLQ